MLAQRQNNLTIAFKEVGCDKHTHGYDRVYAETIKDGMSILEVGVFRGESVLAWKAVYPNSPLTVIDTFERISADKLPMLDDVTVIKGDSTKANPTGEYDIIIDDGCHTHECQLATFRNLFPFLKEGGTYFIEDVWPFDKMTDIDKQHPWIRGKSGWSDGLYRQLKEALQPYDRDFHDLRRVSAKPDSFLIEVKK